MQKRTRLHAQTTDLVEEEGEVGDHGLLVRAGGVHDVFDIEELGDAQVLAVYTQTCINVCKRLVIGQVLGGGDGGGVWLCL